MALAFEDGVDLGVVEVDLAIELVDGDGGLEGGLGPGGEFLLALDEVAFLAEAEGEEGEGEGEQEDVDGLEGGDGASLALGARSGGQERGALGARPRAMRAAP
ncbi:MAG: hypothetical protein M5U12_22345 [Verrucomicrobia bacterium]|nr:hypothetical protein [Verrucomicrobiota bacterium]